MLVQQNDPSHVYTTQEISAAMRIVAQSKGRPYYDMVVCHAVRDSIRGGTDHPLKQNVLGVLGHRVKQELSIRGSMVTGESGRTSTLKEMYSDEKIQKIDFLRKWCNERKGSLMHLVRFTGDQSHRLTRKLRFTCFYEDDKLNQAYTEAMRIVQEETQGVNKVIGTQKNEFIFVGMLRMYCLGILTHAYRKVVSGVKHHRVHWDGVVNMWVPVIGITFVTPTTQVKFMDYLQEQNLLKFKDEVAIDSECGFRLMNIAHCKHLYRLAFEEIVMSSRNSGFKKNLTSLACSSIATNTLPKMMKYVFDAYDISPANREKH